MPKILMELSSSIYGYAGIPQDARLTFKLLSEVKGLELSGLILDNGNNAFGIRSKRRERNNRNIGTASRFIAALTDRDLSAKAGRTFVQRLHRSVSSVGAFAGNYMGAYSKPFPIDSNLYSDFIWSTIFANSLQGRLRKNLTAHNFYGCGTNLAQLISSALMSLPRMPIDTSGFDYFLVQKPFYARVPESTRMIVRYHDSIPITHPQFTIYPRLAQKAHYKSLISNSEKSIFVCNSESTRSALIELFPRAKGRVYTAHCAVSDEYYPDDSQDLRVILAQRLNYRLVVGAKASVGQMIEMRDLVERKFNGRYFIVVGSLEPRKNHLRVIDAWERLRSRTGADIKLVFVASSGWNNKKEVKVLRHHALGGDLVVLGNVPSFQLRALYSQACATIAASFAEGFNIVGVESMKCGTPVLASNIAVHCEIFKDGGAFFDPYSEEGLVREMEKVAEQSDAERTAQAKKCEQIAGHYKPENIVRQWMDVFSV